MNLQGKKIAICQPKIILGGRLSVIIGIVKAANDLGIVPDIVTSKLSFQYTDIEKMYGRNVRFNIKFMSLPVPMWGDWRVLGFNRGLEKIAHNYDLVVNTSNSLALLPVKDNVLSYVFYPRESRIRSEHADIHFPEKKLNLLSPRGMSRYLLRRAYRHTRPFPDHRIVAMTEFTRRALDEVYPLLSQEIPVIYPAVQMSDFWSDQTDREKAVVTVGRFAPDKRQLEQIRIAQQLPEFQFHIFGFKANAAYFKRCQSYIRQNNIRNVQVHPNAPFSQILNSLRSSRYFLHTLINEPFGLTAVQAMAAGCIPVVHDSGGQVETVPVSDLRYDSFNRVVPIIRSLDNLPGPAIDELRAVLQNHIHRHYDEPIFHRNISEQLVDALG